MLYNVVYKKLYDKSTQSQKFALNLQVYITRSFIHHKHGRNK